MRDQPDDPVGELLERAQRAQKSRKSRSAVVFVALLMLGILASIVVRNELSERSDTECKFNVLSIGTAVTMFGSRCPDRLEDLVPRYLKRVPTCPVSGGAYAYEAGPPLKDQNVQAFTVYCAGENHPRHWARDYPRFTSNDGLQSAPGPHRHGGHGPP
jgi:hypothetical protein